MSSNIECMSSWELCEYSMKTVTEREFVNGLGFGNQYDNITGNPNFDPMTLKELARMVKESAKTLKKDYQSKQLLQQAMEDELFKHITNPIMESFAHRVWNGSDLSDPPPGRHTMLLYTDEEDNKLIAKNLFCWVCRKFVALFRSTTSTNIQTESVPLPDSLNETTIRGRRHFIRREPGKCWINYSTPVGNDVDPPLDLPTNASSSVDLDQGRDERDTGNSLSNATGSSSKLGRKRKQTADNDDDVTDPDHYLVIWRSKPDKVSSQLRVNAEHETINQPLVSGSAGFVPHHNEENTSLWSYTSHGLPPTPKSRGDRSHNVADGAESGIDSAIEHCLSLPLSPLPPGSRDHNVSRASLSRAIATVGIPAAEEAIEDDTPPGTPPVAGPTTEANAVEEPTGDILALHHRSEVAAPETTSVPVEHSNSHRLEAKEGKLKTWDKRKEVRLRKAVFDWLDPDMKDNKGPKAKQALQLIQTALEEDSQRLNETWETSFESNCKRIRGWIDFVLEIARCIYPPDDRDSPINLLANENDLRTDDLRGSKLLREITNAQEAWHNTHPELESSDLENGLGLLLRDVVFPNKKHPLSKQLGDCLEKLLEGFNKDIKLMVTL